MSRERQAAGNRYLSACKDSKETREVRPCCLEIIIGGCVTPEQFEALAALIVAEDLRLEWEGEPSDADKTASDQPLRLYAYIVAWARFQALEQYCCGQQNAFQRWSGGFPQSLRSRAHRL